MRTLNCVWMKKQLSKAILIRVAFQKCSKLHGEMLRWSWKRTVSDKLLVVRWTKWSCPLQVMVFILLGSLMGNCQSVIAKGSSTRVFAHMYSQDPSRWAPNNQCFPNGGQASLASYRRVCQVEQALKKTKKAEKEAEQRTQRNDPPQDFLREFHQWSQLFHLTSIRLSF